MNIGKDILLKVYLEKKKHVFGEITGLADIVSLSFSTSGMLEKKPLISLVFGLFYFVFSLFSVHLFIRSVCYDFNDFAFVQHHSGLKKPHKSQDSIQNFSVTVTQVVRQMYCIYGLEITALFIQSPHILEAQ